MKQYLLILAMLLGTDFLMAQTNTVSNLSVTGTGIKWYLSQTGGTALDPSAQLVNGQHYWASQTVNNVESTSRFEVIATLNALSAPSAGTHTASQSQVDWNWNTASGATGYKWNTTNSYGTATNTLTATTLTETGLSCNTAYTRYIWAYNASCVSGVSTLTQTTSSCIAAPSVATSAANPVGATTATLNGSITSTGGATVTARGFKYSTTNGFNPLTTGTNISESGSYSTGSFSLSPSDLTSTTTYYACAFATNSAGTTYGSQVSYTTTLYTAWTFNNAGAGGRTGPTQSQVNTAYSGSSLQGGVAVNTQGIQEWTVPVTGTYRITAQGAGGGANYYTQRVRGGYGAKMTGDFALTAGQVLKIAVGQRGPDGGEDDYNTGSYPQTAGGSGGGGSFVTLSDNSPLIIAGGGGGATTRISYAGQIGGDGLTSGPGGSGTGPCGGTGGSNGSGGIGSCNTGYQGGSGGGGLLGSGGNTVGNIQSYGAVSTGGTAFTGGATGGIGGTGAAVGNCRDGGFGAGGCGGYDGGGGGGYSGGGGGGDDGSGGGGSYNTGSNPSNTAGYNSGNGEVSIILL